METAKIFSNGGSQAVRLPKEYRFSEKEVYVNKVGNIVMLIPVSDPWKGMEEGLAMFTEDCLREIPEDLPLQERDGL